MGDALDELREKVALSCRILAMMGLVRDLTGHVSARIPGTQEMFIRCRSDHEEGIAYTGADTICRVDLNGRGEGVALFGKVRQEQYEVPAEFPIHGELLRARSEEGCVIHAHPPAVLLCGISGVELRPIFGAYDPAAMALSVGGIPVFPRSCLIESQELGATLANTMGSKNVCILRGHGIAVTGATVEEATIRAIKLETLARVGWQLALAGRQAPDISPEDLQGFLQRSTRAVRSYSGAAGLWRYYVRMLKEGRRIPDDLALGVEGF